VSHSESVNIQFEKSFSIDKVKKALDNFEGCKVIDERADGGYSTPLKLKEKMKHLFQELEKIKL
jgi:aspartate-semialdehyde dehydrogenase